MCIYRHALVQRFSALDPKGDFVAYVLYESTFLEHSQGNRNYSYGIPITSAGHRFLNIGLFSWLLIIFKQWVALLFVFSQRKLADVKGTRRNIFGQSNQMQLLLRSFQLWSLKDSRRHSSIHIVNKIILPWKFYSS